MNDLTKAKITKTVVENAPTPVEGDHWVWDSELEGFGIRVQASGRKTYVVRYRTRDDKRTQRKVTLCRCSDAPPDKARQMARELFQKVAAGTDPAAERKAASRDAGRTVEALFEARVKAMREKDRACADEVERVLLKAKNNAADWLGRKKAPADVTADEIVKFVATFYKAGHRGAADKARSYLSAAFNWAILSANDYTETHRRDWGLTRNPVADVAKDQNAVTVRNRNLSAEELRAVWEACSHGNGGLDYSIEALLKILIACGQRVHETLRVEGREIDLDKALWTMPAHKTKGRQREHCIPLPKIILPTFQALKEMHGDGPLFPARTSTSPLETMNLCTVSMAVRRWLATEGNTIEAFQPRDLRRTWKSRAGDGPKISKEIRDLIQQHAQNDTGTKHYDRSDYLPEMREAMDKWSKWLEGTVYGNPELRLVA